MEELDKEISPKKVAAVTAAVYQILNGQKKQQKKYQIISIKKTSQNWKR
ncbi:hypothetical protein DFR79_1422 [Halanaerobium saccharolyticum]|uniref:Uncharacterized protein n=1 Tax=Halanaerobium saccharolyticum TaxID=43595 RepID=A0A4R6LB59_9FIRM|nr:hypothetical protein [Halanaerobium saccharolyticum]TDO73001.1 hypothetical protein DFR79_1422 [Halanaerobium saccharolyticum]